MEIKPAKSMAKTLGNQVNKALRVKVMSRRLYRKESYFN
jgi:hypothetical protein